MGSARNLLVLSLLILITRYSVSGHIDDKENGCGKCNCKWLLGKRFANCSDLSLKSIPSDLSSSLQVFDFSSNPILKLDAQVFKRNGIINAQKLYIKNCNLESIEKTAFQDLSLLIELDLSVNNLRKIDIETFRDMINLRTLSINFNKLTRLENELFQKLTDLQRLSVNHNEISWIDQSFFENLPSLRFVDLGHNKLKHITYDFAKNPNQWISWNLEENPWICDCHLEQFRRKIVSERLLIATTSCAEPPSLIGHHWADSGAFICEPTIAQVPNQTTITGIPTTSQ